LGGSMKMIGIWDSNIEWEKGIGKKDWRENRECIRGAYSLIHKGFCFGRRPPLGTRDWITIGAPTPLWTVLAPLSKKGFGWFGVFG
jgi:hypothetical protein